MKSEGFARGTVNFFYPKINVSINFREASSFIPGVEDDETRNLASEKTGEFSS